MLRVWAPCYTSKQLADAQNYLKHLWLRIKLWPHILLNPKFLGTHLASVMKEAHWIRTPHGTQLLCQRSSVIFDPNESKLKLKRSRKAFFLLFQEFVAPSGDLRSSFLFSLTEVLMPPILLLLPFVWRSLNGSGDIWAFPPQPWLGSVPDEALFSRNTGRWKTCVRETKLV